MFNSTPSLSSHNLGLYMQTKMDVEDRVQSTAERKTGVLKGSCAQFLRQNPRFLNEPICHVLPNETSRSVADCMQWTREEVPPATQNV